jgi:hypothetical protein
MIPGRLIRTPSDAHSAEKPDNDGSFKALVDVCATLRDERHPTAWYAGLSSRRGCAQARLMADVYAFS